MIGLSYLNFDQVFIFLAGVVFVLVVGNLSWQLAKRYKSKFSSVTRKYSLSKTGLKLAWAAIQPILYLLIAYLFLDLFVYPPNYTYHSPEQNNTWLDQSQPFVIEFNRPVDKKNMIPQIYPEIEGTWEFSPTIIPGLSTKLEFIPDESFPPETDITIYLGEIRNVLQTEASWDKAIRLESPKIPNVLTTTTRPSSINPHMTSVVFALDNKPGKFVNWSYSSTPSAEFAIKVDEDNNKVILEPLSELPKNTTFEIKLERSSQIYNIKDKSFKQISNTEIVAKYKLNTLTTDKYNSIVPIGNSVIPNTDIQIKFGQPQSPTQLESELKFIPEIKYSSFWSENNQLLTIDPEQNLKANTKYTIEVPSKEIKHSFKTLGKPEIKSISPYNGSNRVDTSTEIIIEFNQEINKDTLMNKFRISPNISGDLNWKSPTTISFLPEANFNHETNYTIKLHTGIVGISGLSSEELSFNFKTAPEKFIIDVPYSRQPLQYACNLTSLQMSLAFAGHDYNVNDLYNKVAKDTTSYTETENSWGNPNKGFVGDITGAQKGYGVHWEPITDLVNSELSLENVTAITKSNWNRNELLQEIQAGNPVIIWAHNNYGNSGLNTSWIDPNTGEEIYSVKGMHSYVVKGWSGDTSNPKSIIVNDPAGRGEWEISPEKFDELWETFNNSAVVIKID